MQTLLKTTKAYQLLQAEGEKSRFSHAYLLHFDDSKNIKSALKLFSKLFFSCSDEQINITNDKGKNRISSLIDEERFSDCLLYPKDGEKFVVEDAEEIGEECLLQPVEGEKKVFIITDFSQATAAAQNKLLKLLEEPPKSVIFLLGATSVFSVLPTVLSRVEKLEIPPFEIEQIAGCLARTYQDTKRSFSQTEYMLSAAASGGSVVVAQSIFVGGDTGTLIQDCFSLCLAKRHELPTLIKKVGETKRKKEFLSLIRIVLRDALLLKTEQKRKNIFLRSEEETLEKIAEKFPISTLIYAQELLSQAEQQLFFNTVFPQCIEILFLKILQHKELAQMRENS